jgi:PAS domain S-box-containing protein
VLIVDDEPVVQLLLQEVLRDDAALTFADSVATALGQAAAGEFDVALVDKNLPDGSGLEILAQLKQRSPTTQVILMSAYPSLDSAIEALHHGAYDYLLKPFDDVTQLRVKVRNAGDKRRLMLSEGRLTRQLSESEERYLQLFHASPDAIIVHDLVTGRIADTNQAAQRLYGYTADEFRQLTASQLAGNPRPGPPSREEEALGSGLLHREDRRKSGEPIAVEVALGSFRQDGGDMAVEIVRDVGERLRAERTRQMLTDQLRSAQKMEALGRLAGGVAHDFNNLLTVIHNYAQFVYLQAQSGAMNAAELADFSEQIICAARSATEITARLLAFSRRQVLAPSVLDLNATITGLAKLMRGALGEGVQLSILLAPELWRIRLDRAQMEQLLLNLAVNARDAMPEGGQVVIATGNVELDPAAATALGAAGPGRYVRLEFSDTGTGMSPEVLEHAFEPFFSTKTPDKGTGLGLTTVYGAVQQGGGTIRVTSEAGRGTAFAIYLPATDEPTAATARPAPTPAARGNGETILVVENDEPVRRVTRQILGEAGYAIAEARNGEEGLLVYRRHAPHIALVIADVVMPGLGGRELIRRLVAQHGPIRVLYMSGYAAESLIAEPEGGAIFLPKPFTASLLLAAVRRVLDAPPISGPG